MHIISHWDLDGIVSAALVVKHAVARKHYHITKRLSTITALPRFTQEFLRIQTFDPTYTYLFILDLNPLKNSYTMIKDHLKTIVSYGIRVYWIDHHSWRREYIDELKDLGAVIYIDTAKVTAEIVADLFKLDDRLSRTLVDLARDDDLFLNRMDITIYWRRVLRWFDWKVRYKALDSFVRGEIWPNWARGLYGQIHGIYERLLEKTLANTVVKEYSGLTIAISQSVDQRIHPGEIQLKLIDSGIYADLYVIVYPNAVSLRSDSIDVSLVAKKLGGGGHPNASGIPINDIPIDVMIEKIIELAAKTKLRREDLMKTTSYK